MIATHPQRRGLRGNRVGGCLRCGGDILKGSCIHCGWEGFSRWPRERELAAKVMREGRRAIRLASGSVLYVRDEG